MHKVFLALTFLATVNGGVIKDDVKIRVNPLVISCALSDPRVWITSTIREHPDNRFLTIRWESSDGESGSTGYQLDGEASPRVFFVERRVDCSNYTIQSCIKRRSVKEEICSLKVLLVGG